MSEHSATPNAPGDLEEVDPASVALLRLAIDGLVEDMHECRRLREDVSALSAREAALEREIEDAEIALRKSESAKPVPFLLAITRGIIRPDLQRARRDWRGLLRALAMFYCVLSLLALLVAIR